MGPEILQNYMESATSYTSQLPSISLSKVVQAVRSNDYLWKQLQVLPESIKVACPSALSCPAFPRLAKSRTEAETSCAVTGVGLTQRRVAKDDFADRVKQ